MRNVRFHQTAVLVLAGLLSLPTAAAAAKRLAASPELTASTQSSSSIGLSWTAVSTRVSDYSIERSDGSSSGFQMIAKRSSEFLTYTDTGLSSSKI
jgi:hypothetical protein